MTNNKRAAALLISFISVKFPSMNKNKAIAQLTQSVRSITLWLAIQGNRSPSLSPETL